MSEKTLPTNMVYIILVNYNGWEDTVECISSLFNMKINGEYKVLIVDNNSTNDSVANLKKIYCDEDKVIIIPTTTNNGFSAGNNIGIKYALQNQATHIWLLNNDTTVDINCLANLLVATEKHNNSLIGVKIYDFENKKKICSYGGEIKGILFRTKEMFTRTFDCPETFKERKVQWITGCSLFAEKTFFEQLLLDERFFLYEEDFALSMEARMKGFQLWVIPNSFIWHKGGKSTGKIPIATRYYQRRNRLIVVSRYAPILSKILIFIIEFTKLILRILKLLIRGYLFTDQYYIMLAKAEFKAAIDFINDKTGKMN